MLASKALAKATRAIAYLRPNTLELKRFDAAMLGTVWTGGPTRAPEIIYSLLLKGHQVSFLWKAPLAALAHHMRQLSRSTEYGNHWELAWQVYHTARAAKYGVLKAWHEALQQLGWEWEQPLQLKSTHTGERYHLTRDTPPRLQHEGREALRLDALRGLAKRRASSAGLEQGADRVRSTALLSHIEDPYLDGFLRNLLAGGVMVGTLRMALGAADHADCVWCRSAPDTSEHLLVHCAATEPIRAWAGITQQELLALPPCVLHHAVFPKGWGEGGVPAHTRTAEKWRSPRMFLQLQLFQLVLHVCRAVAQLQPEISLFAEMPPAIRSEVELTAYNAGLALTSLPPLAAPRIPPVCTVGAPQPVEASS